MHAKVRRHSPLVVPLTLLLAAAARDPAVQINQEIALLEFIGGGTTLSAAERQQAAAIVHEGETTAPDTWNKVDQQSAGLLAKLDSGIDPRRKARLRAALRLSAAIGPPPGNPLAQEGREEAAIIAAHDPPVVWDAPHRRLISTVAVAVMVATARQAAPVFGQAAPGADAAPRLAAMMRSRYAAMDDGMQGLLAAAEANLPAALPYLQRAPEMQRTRFIQQMLKEIQQGRNADDRLLRLVQMLAGLGARGAAAAGEANAASGFQLRQEDLLQKQMLGASRSYSPQCNVYSGANQANFSYCHP